MIDHVKTHGAEKRFSCQHCNKAFSRKFSLKRHEDSCLPFSPLSQHTLPNVSADSLPEAEVSVDAAAAANDVDPLILDENLIEPEPEVVDPVQLPMVEAAVSDPGEGTSRTSHRPRRVTRSEALSALEQKIVTYSDDGLYVKYNLPGGKGRGVFASRKFARGDYITTYTGEVVSAEEGERRLIASERAGTGSFVYFFRYNEQRRAIDSTPEPPMDGPSMHGRLINHLHVLDKPNAKTTLKVIDGQPYIVFVALRKIKEDEEILYDYGDHEHKSWTRHPWLGPASAQDMIKDWIRTNRFPLTQETQETEASYHSQMREN
jgi:hypothetical protein